MSKSIILFSILTLYFLWTSMFLSNFLYHWYYYFNFYLYSYWYVSVVKTWMFQKNGARGRIYSFRFSTKNDRVNHESSHNLFSWCLLIGYPEISLISYAVQVWLLILILFHRISLSPGYVQFLFSDFLVFIFST